MKSNPSRPARRLGKNGKFAILTVCSALVAGLLAIETVRFYLIVLLVFYWNAAVILNMIAVPCSFIFLWFWAMSLPNRNDKITRTEAMLTIVGIFVFSTLIAAGVVAVDGMLQFIWSETVEQLTLPR